MDFEVGYGGGEGVRGKNGVRAGGGKTADPCADLLRSSSRKSTSKDGSERKKESERMPARSRDSAAHSISNSNSVGWCRHHILQQEPRPGGPSCCPPGWRVRVRLRLASYTLGSGLVPCQAL